MKRLVLGGGGIKCFSYIGCYEYFIEHDMLKDLEHVIGVSGGAIMGLCIALKLHVHEMYEMSYNKNPLDLDDISLKVFLKTFGLNDGTNLERFIKIILDIRNLNENTTMKELYELTKIKLSVCVTNLQTYTSEIFDETSDMTVIDAIYCSCTIPLLLSPKKIKDVMYVDGGMCFKFPYEYISDDTIGICVVSKTCKSEIHSLKEYLLHLFYMFSSYVCVIDTDKHNKNVVYLNVKCEFAHSGIISKDVMSQIVSSGYEGVKTFFIN
jgi:predicted acylesterase/phospholipase RssA